MCQFCVVRTDGVSSICPLSHLGNSLFPIVFFCFGKELFRVLSINSAESFSSHGYGVLKYLFNPFFFSSVKGGTLCVE